MTYQVMDVPQSVNCENCVPCMRTRLMEMGFISGQDIEVGERKLGLHIIHMLSKSGHIEQTFALRPEELGIICLNQK
jgi:Fe2+ transport system protein FeoA